MNGHRRIISAVATALRREWIVALGRTAPNPAVSAVVLAEAEVDGLPAAGGVLTHTSGEPRIFSGGTEPPGGRHAEVVALDAFDDFIRQSTQLLGACAAVKEELPPRLQARRMYVSLEPCSHHGRTPPCTDRILRYASLRDLIVLVPDPSLPRSGCEILRAADRRVRLRGERWVAPGSPDTPGTSQAGPATIRRFAAASGALTASLGQEMLAGFRSRIAGRGPRLHFKLAVTHDGAIGVSGRRLMISGERALQFGQLLRAKLDAVVVGPGTIAADRPSLALRPEELGELRTQILDGECSGQPDLLLDSLREHELAVRETIAATPAAYQPERVLILGRPFAAAVALLARQFDLTQTTARPARFAFLPDCRELWRPLFDEARRETAKLEQNHTEAIFDLRAAHELPALTDPEFSVQLRAWLGNLGYNEVMVEGGAALFSALYDRAADQSDRLYLLRSKRSLSQLLEGGPSQAAIVRAPAEALVGALRASLDLGADVLEVRGPGGRRSDA